MIDETIALFKYVLQNKTFKLRRQWFRVGSSSVEEEGIKCIFDNYSFYCRLTFKELRKIGVDAKKYAFTSTAANL